jgi:hypothetical protein
MVSVVSIRPRPTLAGLAVATVLLGASGCTDLDEASAAGITGDDLVSEIAGQLARVTALTYTAKYHLAGGDTATFTQAQRPTRTAYAFPGGRLIETPAATIRCNGPVDKPLTCTETDPVPATASPLNGAALVTPEAALAMLNTASLDQEVTTSARDTTVAGRHANCLSLAKVDDTPASEFTLCVTNEGALASFTATIAGVRIDQTLTAYAEKADRNLLDLPPTAKVTDRRTR